MSEQGRNDSARLLNAWMTIRQMDAAIERNRRIGRYKQSFLQLRGQFLALAEESDPPEVRAEMDKVAADLDGIIRGLDRFLSCPSS
jgi:hypothetical protein